MVELTLKVNRITEQYLERFGKVRMAIYHLVVFQQEPFSSFINSLMITLRRKDQMPCFAWFSTTAPDSRYLIVWCNGYFKTDFSDITPIVSNLGKLHSLRSISFTDGIIGGIFDVDQINVKLNNLISWH